ncbi:glycosyltransferase family 4 protein [Thermosulfurimonas dismutans]|uniref:Putative glycosyltransferase protein n=1 Tax=Thermosulfurimonas dismutans TaxID=999894 RepID=A0A179D1B7_9BACT|nr:glycosyltransferase family 4 protein [Thermosulfurimonas dismutans]OAQ19847.1 putative glycosyltransferase protein [Thermosulfurimonas dismutans]
MEILIANKFFYLKGGSERVLFQEREFLLNNKIKVIDFSMKDSRNFSSEYSSYFVSYIDYYTTNRFLIKLKNAFKFIHSPEAVRKIKFLIQKEKPDIAHLHNIYHQLTPSIIHPLKEQGVKVILTLHDGKLICPTYLMLDRKIKLCLECQGKYFYKPFLKNCAGSRFKGLLLMVEAYWHKFFKSYDKVDLFIAPSRFLAEVVSQRIPREKIVVLRNGIDLNEYRPTYEDGGYALYFGRLSREKGVETLLEAHQEVAKEIPLKIVGTGPMEAELKAKYPEAEFLGYRTGEELKSLVARASFVVVPSECYENCPMTVLEAMALGKPIIASRIGGLPELVEEGKTGLLFEMGNVEELKEKMLFLWKNKDLRREMGRAARQKAEREFSLEKHCEELLRIYRRLLES